MNYTRASPGFTLIEVIISTALLSLLLGQGVVSTFEMSEIALRANRAIKRSNQKVNILQIFELLIESGKVTYPAPGNTSSYLVLSPRSVGSTQSTVTISLSENRIQLFAVNEFINLTDEKDQITELTFSSNLSGDQLTINFKLNGQELFHKKTIAP